MDETKNISKGDSTGNIIQQYDAECTTINEWISTTNNSLTGMCIVANKYIPAYTSILVETPLISQSILDSDKTKYDIVWWNCNVLLLTEQWLKLHPNDPLGKIKKEYHLSMPIAMDISTLLTTTVHTEHAKRLCTEYNVSLKTVYRLCRIMANYCYVTWNLLSKKLTGTAIYRFGSLFNHACVPNCYHICTADGRLMITNVCDIKKGEELFITVMPGVVEKVTTVRQESLKNLFGFQCICKTCKDYPNITKQDVSIKQVISDGLFWKSLPFTKMNTAVSEYNFKEALLTSYVIITKLISMQQWKHNFEQFYRVLIIFCNMISEFGLDECTKLIHQKYKSKTDPTEVYKWLWLNYNTLIRNSTFQQVYNTQTVLIPDHPYYKIHHQYSIWCIGYVYMVIGMKLGLCKTEDDLKSIVTAWMGNRFASTEWRAMNIIIPEQIDLYQQRAFALKPIDFEIVLDLLQKAKTLQHL
jgi:hypothetical protein